MVACLDALLFWSVGFAGQPLPWITWAIGDLGVKLVLGVCLLLPFRLLMGRVLAADSATAPTQRVGS